MNRKVLLSKICTHLKKKKKLPTVEDKNPNAGGKIPKAYAQKGYLERVDRSSNTRNIRHYVHKRLLLSYYQTKSILKVALDRK